MIQSTLIINCQIIVLSCKILRDWCWQQKLRVSKLLMKKSKSNTEQLASILAKDWLQCVAFRKIVEYFVFCHFAFGGGGRPVPVMELTKRRRHALFVSRSPSWSGRHSTSIINTLEPFPWQKKRHTGPGTQQLLSRRGCMFNNTLWDCQTNIPNLTHAINIKYDDSKNNSYLTVEKHCQT